MLNGYGVSFWDDKNVLELEVIAVRYHECTECLCIVHLTMVNLKKKTMVNFVLCTSYLDKKNVMIYSMLLNYFFRLELKLFIIKLSIESY